MTTNAVTDENRYNIDLWGEGYFTVNPEGNVEISDGDASSGVELVKIVKAASRAGLHMPLLLRFSHILYDRVTRLYRAFSESIEETGYQGHYQLVYPIKVNQEQCVVRELLKSPEHSIGLEAGSKPELMAVLGLLGDAPSTIVCNGYKDRSYVRIALIAQQMGHQVFIVVEKPSELDIILREAEKLGVHPHIGVRIRLVTKGAGKWENTGGSKSKFGLNAEQVVKLVNDLKEKGALDYLRLMHCHLGSQIANIQDIRNCMQEVARYYIELRKFGASIDTVDVGGGLGVDYEGTRSNTGCSMNYSESEYATHILLALRDLCKEAEMPEPNIISESGRSLTAHHAVLVTNITGAESVDKVSALPVVDEDESRVVHDILDTYHSIDEKLPADVYHYAAHALEEASALFKHGVISLEGKAKVEQLFNLICCKIHHLLDDTLLGDSELIPLINERLATKLFCNVSFFQSLPDAWAINQIFPVVPITDLNEAPTMHAILQDLTCDSDGTLKQYTGKSTINSTLELPEYNAEAPYALGFFLVGAYQEILGNLHNLFGDTNSLEVKLTGHGEFELSDLTSGDTITNVLNFAHYDIKKLSQSYEKQLLANDLSEELAESYLDELRSIFSHLTYLDSRKGLLR
jgi:arginine decarboxylase